MKYFLDTNIISYFLKGKYPSIQDHFISIPSQDVYIPTIVVAEIEYGTQKSSNYRKTISYYTKFLNVFQIIPFNERASFCYGQIRSQLETKGQVIGANDMLIAATVIAENGILVTNNAKEFSRIPGLRIEDWTTN